MNAPVTQTPPETEAPKKSGAGRLLILLGLLAVMIGALAYDRLYAAPGKEAAIDRINKAVEAKVYAGVPEAGDAKDKAQLLPTDQDIREAIGFAPKWTKKDGDYTLQCFHWWGPIPLNRNYLIVRYRGTKPLLFVDFGDGETPKDRQFDGKDSPTIAPTMPGQGPPGGAAVAGGPPAEGDEKGDAPASDKPEDKKPEEPKEAAATEDAEKPASE